MGEGIDCNNCINLNMTEQEQLKLKDNSKNHVCKEYNTRVLHLSSSKNHDPKLHPCTECRADIYRHYHRRNL
jgi:hypothetical protein